MRTFIRGRAFAVTNMNDQSSMSMQARHESCNAISIMQANMDDQSSMSMQARNESCNAISIMQACSCNKT